MKTKNTPHVHAEIIKQWADGAVIQVYDSEENEWGTFTNGTPTWNSNYLYRVKPEVVYPKTTLTPEEINDSYWKNGPEYESCNNGYKRICDEAIEHFIKSGAMQEYIDSLK